MFRRCWCPLERLEFFYDNSSICETFSRWPENIKTRTCTKLSSFERFQADAAINPSATQLTSIIIFIYFIFHLVLGGLEVAHVLIDADYFLLFLGRYLFLFFSLFDCI